MCIRDSLTTFSVQAIPDNILNPPKLDDILLINKLTSNQELIQRQKEIIEERSKRPPDYIGMYISFGVLFVYACLALFLLALANRESRRKQAEKKKVRIQLVSGTMTLKGTEKSGVTTTSGGQSTYNTPQKAWKYQFLTVHPILTLFFSRPDRYNFKLIHRLTTLTSIICLHFVFNMLFFVRLSWAGPVTKDWMIFSYSWWTTLISIVIVYSTIGAANWILFSLHERQVKKEAFAFKRYEIALINWNYFFNAAIITGSLLAFSFVGSEKKIDQAWEYWVYTTIVSIFWDIFVLDGALVIITRCLQGLANGSLDRIEKYLSLRGFYDYRSNLYELIEFDNLDESVLDRHSETKSLSIHIAPQYKQNRQISRAGTQQGIRLIRFQRFRNS
eukprot:TRINITY_DN10027_c0_g1_i7.p1 TRINITY_DN10027_c0_g1~~TRINITY_DN10027_c0_g1_i7.p1  ORF type:complete len:388 (+),score=77.30 TRINITY_DN10027_c0_g1_i7:65-1228(+)